MAEGTKTVLVTGWAQTGPVPLSVNGSRVLIPVGKPTEIAADLVDVLGTMAVDFKVVEPQPPVVDIAVALDARAAALDAREQDLAAREKAADDAKAEADALIAEYTAKIEALKPDDPPPPPPSESPPADTGSVDPANA